MEFLSLKVCKLVCKLKEKQKKKKNKFNHLILPLGYKGRQIKNFISKNKNFDLKIDEVNTHVLHESLLNQNQHLPL